MQPVEVDDGRGGFDGDLVYQTLITNDTVEGHLFKLVPAQHVARTGHRFGAEDILAARPPGSPILPPWMADCANPGG